MPLTISRGLALLDPGEQVVGPSIHMGLTHAEGDALVHGKTEGQLIFLSVPDEPFMD